MSEAIVTQGTNTIRAHPHHLKEHGAEEHNREAVALLKERGMYPPPEEPRPARLPCGCPGSAVRESKRSNRTPPPTGATPGGISELAQWPVQLALVPPGAPYIEKLTEIIRSSDLASLTVVHMEVPCCFALSRLAQEAAARSGVQIPVKDVTVSVEGAVMRTAVVRV